MEPNETPRIFSERYELNHLIARGGMAEVYRAHDRLLDRPVALKVLFPELSVDRSFVERFRREAQAAANLSHPNIVPVFDWGEDTGTYFIVMEFIDGRPLSAILKTAGPLSADRTADIGAHVAAALGYAHKHGVIHRDVKPGNVLITDEGQVKVTDFGIARAINTEESLTQTGAVMGTATYFSPEQAEGMGVDARSDIYSLGVVLFEMATGRPPFLGDTPVAVASKHVRDHPPAPRELNPAIPPTFEAIILKAMAKNPEHRYATAEDLRADLLRFNEGRTVLAMDDATSLLAVAGTTAVVGTVAGMDVTQSVSATPPAEEVEDEEAGSNRTRTYAIILAILVLLLLVAGYFLARNLGYLGGSASFNLPSVTGQPVGQATAKLTQDGLVVKHTAADLHRHPRHGHLDQSGRRHPGEEGGHGDTDRRRGGEGHGAVRHHQHHPDQRPVPAGGRRSHLDRQQRAQQRRPGDGAQRQPAAGHQGGQGQLGHPHRLVRSGRRAGAVTDRAEPDRGRQPARPGRPQRRQHHLGPVGQLQHRPGHLLQSVRRHVRQAGQLGGHRGLDRPAADHHDVDVDHDHLDDQPLFEHDRVAAHHLTGVGRGRSGAAQAARVEARKFDRRPGPSRVSSDSGWNWTPSTARVRWRRPMITPSAVRAVTSSTSGTLAGSTTREW